MPRFTSPPLKGKNLEDAADERRHQEELNKSLKDICLNAFYMFIVFSICYSTRDDRYNRSFM